MDLTSYLSKFSTQSRTSRLELPKSENVSLCMEFHYAPQQQTTVFICCVLHVGSELQDPAMSGGAAADEGEG